MVHSISSLAVLVDTLGGYNWRHRCDFPISTFNPLNGSILYQNFIKKLFNFLSFLSGLGEFKVEIEKSPWWRHLYSPKVSTATASVGIDWTMWAVGGACNTLGPSSALIRVPSVMWWRKRKQKRLLENKNFSYLYATQSIHDCLFPVVDSGGVFFQHGFFGVTSRRWLYRAFI